MKRLILALGAAAAVAGSLAATEASAQTRNDPYRYGQYGYDQYEYDQYRRCCSCRWFVGFSGLFGNY